MAISAQKPGSYNPVYQPHRGGTKSQTYGSRRQGQSFSMGRSISGFLVNWNNGSTQFARNAIVYPIPLILVSAYVIYLHQANLREARLFSRNTGVVNDLKLHNINMTHKLGEAVSPAALNAWAADHNMVKADGKVIVVGAPIK